MSEKSQSHVISGIICDIPKEPISSNLWGLKGIRVKHSCSYVSVLFKQNLTSFSTMAETCSVLLVINKFESISVILLVTFYDALMLHICLLNVGATIVKHQVFFFL